MHEAFSNEYVSMTGTGGRQIIPASVKRGFSALVFLGLVVGMSVWAYRLGTRDAHEVPVIRAMEGPARQQPEDAGGMTTAHQGHEINTVIEGSPAPVPRQSSVKTDNVALTAEDGPQGELIQAAPFQPEETTGDLAIVDAPIPELTEDPEGPASLSPETAVTEKTPGDLVAEIAVAESTQPAGPRPRSRPGSLFSRVSGSAKSFPAAADPALREVSGVAAGSNVVQLGAFDSEEITRQAWKQLATKHDDLLGGKSLYIQRTTNSARVFYRLRVTGFDGRSQTSSLCEALKARSVDCIPVTLQ